MKTKANPQKINKLLSISKATVLFAVLFLLISITFKGGGLDERIKILLTVSSFLFGIFVAFATSNSNSRINKLSEMLGIEESCLLFYYHAADVFGKKVKNDLQKLIDDVLIEQLDYFLVDFDYSGKSFMKLFKYIVSEVKPEKDNKPQEATYIRMLNTLSEQQANRKQVELLVKQSMLKLEWTCIIILLAIMLFCIFYMNDQTVISILISVLLSTTAVTFVLVLRDLNDLRWKERIWIWEDLHRVFKELDLLPYYPQAVLTSKRAVVDEGEEVRIATYPHPYPNMSDKKIEVVIT